MNYRDTESKIIKLKNRFNVYYHVNINDNRMPTGAALRLRRMFCLGEFNTYKKKCTAYVAIRANTPKTQLNNLP